MQRTFIQVLAIAAMLTMGGQPVAAQKKVQKVQKTVKQTKKKNKITMSEEAFINDLMSKMTLKEKIGQLSQ